MVTKKEFEKLEYKVDRLCRCCEQTITIVEALPEEGEEGIIYVLPTGEAYVWDGETFIAFLGALNGPTGPQGPTGATGPTGSVGDLGIVQSLSDSNENEGTGSYYDLTSGSGRAFVVFGNAEGYAEFLFDSDGVPTFLRNSSNVFTTLQTGTNHVIIKDNGSNVRIVNEMGATASFNILTQYT